MPSLIDLTGNQYGDLTVLGRDTERNGVYWIVQCVCRNRYSIRGTGLTYDGVVRCPDCTNRKKSEESKLKTHGRSDTTEYKSWCMMKSRCNNPNYTHHEYYGGRGIKVCDRWNESFDAFYEDMGDRPTPKHTLDRIDSNGNYTPENCRWATRHEQVINRRNEVLLEYQGRQVSLVEIAMETGIPRAKLYSYLYRGYTLEEALTKIRG